MISNQCPDSSSRARHKIRAYSDVGPFHLHRASISIRIDRSAPACSNHSDKIQLDIELVLIDFEWQQHGLAGIMMNDLMSVPL